MRTKIFSRSLVVLSLFILTGASGCAGTSSQPPPKPLAVTQPTVESSTAVDTSDWKNETIEKGFTFSYPPQLNYLSGGQVETGSYSWITGEQPEDIYFEIFDLAVTKPATVEDVYAETIASFVTDDFYFPAEQISIAGTTGQKFRIREDRNDGIARTAVVFQNANGVYLISDYQLTPDNTLFDAFVGTFR